jgi:predicted esterase
VSRFVSLIGLVVLLIGVISCQAEPNSIHPAQLSGQTTVEPLPTRTLPVQTALPTLVSSVSLSSPTIGSPVQTALPTLVSSVPSPVPTLVLPTSTPVPSRDISIATPVQRPTLGSVQETDVQVLRAKPTAIPFKTSVPPAPPFELYTHLPPNATQHQPLPVLVVLHGMGAQGESFASGLIADADANGWVLVAPTIPYSNCMDPKDILDDDVRFLQTLRQTLDGLPNRLHLRLQPRVMLFGFSRGAQLAHRFALFFPEYVSAVAALSAGTYTLPIEKRKLESGEQPVLLPYGVGDSQNHVARMVDWDLFKKVVFWLGVGEKDNRAGDVPRSFDQYIGNTRIERACAFEAALEKLGVKTQLVIFPGADHEVTAEMRRSLVKFFYQTYSSKTQN